MSKIRKEVEYYRLPDEIDAEMDGDNVAENHNNVNTGELSGPNRRIVNIADGTGTNDAVNLGQLQDAINSIPEPPEPPDLDPYVKIDGSRSFTENQSMGSNKLTDVRDGTTTNDAVNLGQLQAVESSIPTSSIYSPYGIVGKKIGDGIEMPVVMSVSPGQKIDSTNTIVGSINSTIYKDFNSSWVQGDNGGMLGDGNYLTASSWYHMFLLIDDEGVFPTDVGLLPVSDVINSNLPNGYSHFAHIFTIPTDSQADLVDFTHWGDKIVYHEMQLFQENIPFGAGQNIILPFDLNYITGVHFGYNRPSINGSCTAAFNTQSTPVRAIPNNMVEDVYDGSFDESDYTPIVDGNNIINCELTLGSGSTYSSGQAAIGGLKLGRNEAA